MKKILLVLSLLVLASCAKKESVEVITTDSTAILDTIVVDTSKVDTTVVVDTTAK